MVIKRRAEPINIIISNSN